METDIITTSSGYRDFSEVTEILLYSVFKSLRPYGCTYMYYLKTDERDNTYRFTSNPDWINVYDEESLAKADPLKRISEQPLSRMFSWQECGYLDKKEKRVMEARASYGCLDGFNVTLSKDDGKKILVLATDMPSHSIKHEILKNPDLLQEALLSLDQIKF